jgi:hypothetical protein
MTTTKKEIDSYDEIKSFLNKIRKIQARPKIGIIQEQTYQGETKEPQDSRGPLTAPYGYGAGTKKPIPRSVGTEPHQVNTVDSSKEGDEDLAVINNVEVEVHSEDPEDLEISDEEKGKISQLIDDFRTEVSEIAEFYGLHIYPDTAVLNGKITDKGLNFTFEAGNENGALISTSMLKIDNESLDIINKLGKFGIKFSNTINDLLVNRREL